MQTIVGIRNECDGLDVEFEVIPIVDMDNVQDERQRWIHSCLAEVDERLNAVNDEVAKLNKDIDRLKNHADGLDYGIAVISGIVTGIIDSVVVGEWNFAEANKNAHININNKVIDFAKKQPEYSIYCTRALEGKGLLRKKVKDPNRLETAIEFLEWKFHLPGDGAYTAGNFGIDGNTHRLDDLCHHPTMVGLICCIIVQFTGNTLYVNKYGEDINIPVTINDYGNFVGTNPVAKLFSGVINWFITCTKVIANRKGHLISDIATSASLPGTFLSTMAELASIPCFRNDNFLGELRDAFQNGIGTGKGQVDIGVFNKLFDGAQSKFDICTEEAIKTELKRQAMPVVLNEIIVRATYFIRKLVNELKEKQDVMCIDWQKVIPFNNRTIVRMMTIATGTFTAIDMADAAIYAASRSVDVSSFFSNMILKVNFVGVGRLAVAVVSDTGMGVSKSMKMKQRIKFREEQMFLLNAKVYYKQADMWMAAEDTEKALEEACNMMENAAEMVNESVVSVNNSLDNIGSMVSAIEEKNPGLTKALIDELEE